MTSRIVAWKEASDGKIINAFMKRCFDKDEFEAYIIGSPQSVVKFGNTTFEMRKILVDIVFAWTNKRAGGVSKSFSYSLLMLLRYQLLSNELISKSFF